MKKIFFLPAMILVTLFSCSKGSSSTGGSGGNNNGGNNGGNNNGGSGLTITAVSPAQPYPDDEITLTGTGFNPDASKDTVEFGQRTGSTGFAPWHDGLESEWPSLAKVVQASATQLVVRAVNPSTLDYYSFPSFQTPLTVGAQVRTGGKKALTAVIPFKRYLSMGGIYDPEQNNHEIGRPNDSLQIRGTGYNKNGVTFSIGGKAVVPETIDSEAYTNRYSANLRLPKDFFGYEDDETATVTRTVVVRNPDGKTEQQDCVFYKSPQMRVSSMHAEKNVYSLSNLQSTGGVVQIIITGACLKSTATLTIGNNAGSTTTFPLPVSNLPSEVTVDVSSFAATTANYTVYLRRSDGAIYTSCSFTIQP